MNTLNEIESTGEEMQNTPANQVPTLEGHDSDYLPSEDVQENTPGKPEIILDHADGSETVIATTDTTTDPGDVSHSENAEPILPDPGVPDNVDFDERRPLTKILTKEEKDKLRAQPEESLYLPSESAERMVEYFNKIPNMPEEAISVENIEWVTAHQGGLEVIPRFGAFKRTLKRKGARYRQSVTYNGSELCPAFPRDDAALMGVLKGEQAVRQVHHVIGLAGQVTIPLWHSGFWITIRQPSESAILELKQRIALEKVTMGRATSGLVYGNSTVFMAEHVVDMVMDNIHTHSIDLPANESIRQYILTSDLQILAWGLASSIWSKGFHYERAVLDETGAANRVVTEKLNLLRMLIVDNSAMNDWQKSHMSNRRPKSMTTAAVRKYQDEFVFTQGTTLKLNDKMHLKLKTPLLDTYLQQGTRWVASTVDMVNRTLGQDLDDVTRNTFVNEQTKTATTRQYSHWVHEIIFLDADGQERSKVVDTPTIEQALVAASQDNQLVKDYMRGVRNMIDDVTFACICIPFLDEKDQNVYKRHPNLIPLDALHTFFTLIDQRARLIQMRETD